MNYKFVLGDKNYNFAKRRMKEKKNRLLNWNKCNFREQAGSLESEKRALDRARLS